MLSERHDQWRLFGESALVHVDKWSYLGQDHANAFSLTIAGRLQGSVVRDEPPGSRRSSKWTRGAYLSCDPTRGSAALKCLRSRGSKVRLLWQLFFSFFS
jgi:hypothetical protein